MTESYLGAEGLTIHAALLMLDDGRGGDVLAHVLPQLVNIVRGCRDGQLDELLAVVALGLFGSSEILDARITSVQREWGTRQLGKARESETDCQTLCPMLDRASWRRRRWRGR